MSNSNVEFDFDNTKWNAKLSKPGQKVFCKSDYAMELLQMYNGVTQSNKQKDPVLGTKYSILDLKTSGTTVILSLENSTSIVVDMKGEREFLKELELSLDGFIEALNTDEGKQMIIKDYTVTVVNLNPIKASFFDSHISYAKEEFMKEVSRPTKVWKAKILQKNNGGFLVKVGTVTGFLPGSLAAANILRNFEDLIGKEIPVMVDDYLQSSKTFVFSYKKYVQYTLPQKIQSLSLTEKYTGTVTGVSKFGIFIEFSEICTGLIHTSKMSKELLQKFHTYKAGMPIDFWIMEILGDKIILTDNDVNKIRSEQEDGLNLLENTEFRGEIVAIKDYGLIVKFQIGDTATHTGLVPKRNIRKKCNYGDIVNVRIETRKESKITLNIV